MRKKTIGFIQVKAILAAPESMLLGLRLDFNLCDKLNIEYNLFFIYFSSMRSPWHKNEIHDLYFKKNVARIEFRVQMKT